MSYCHWVQKGNQNVHRFISTTNPSRKILDQDFLPRRIDKDAIFNAHTPPFAGLLISVDPGKAGNHNKGKKKRREAKRDDES